MPIGQVSGWQIFSRFYRAEDQNFPILQIGPGIFAANQSSEYDWESFRKLTREGVEILLRESELTHFARTVLTPLGDR